MQTPFAAGLRCACVYLYTRGVRYSEVYRSRYSERPDGRPGFSSRQRNVVQDVLTGKFAVRSCEDAYTMEHNSSQFVTALGLTLLSCAYTAVVV
jgi:hypothetical protein